MTAPFALIPDGARLPRCEWCGKPGATNGGFCAQKCERLYLVDEKRNDERAQHDDDQFADRFDGGTYDDDDMGRD